MDDKDFIIQKKNTVAWHLKISEETDTKFREFQDTHGKRNKTLLVDWLINQYMKDIEDENK